MTLTEEQALNSTLTFDLERDVPRLRRLADEHDVWLGTSSWNYYEGWRDKVYFADYGGKRSDFVKSKFTKTAIAEYSHVFPTVGNDASFYNYPSHKQLQYFSEVLPQNFRMNFKVPKSITNRRFDFQHSLRGQENPDYLSARTFIEHFLAPIVEALGDRVGVIVFEFSPFNFDRSSDYSPTQFVNDLYLFFAQLPNGCKYAVEVRDPELIDPKFHRYLDCCEYHGVSHVLNQQTKMPPISEQLHVAGIFTSSFTMVRALVNPGVSHDEAVKLYSPYTHIQKPNPSLRLSIVALIEHSIEYKRSLTVNANSRAEGNSPDTLANVVDLFIQDYATRGISW